MDFWPDRLCQLEAILCVGHNWLPTCHSAHSDLINCLPQQDDVIKWKHFPRYWPFVRGIHRWPVNSPHKGQWRGALILSLICALNKRMSKQSWGWWFETPLRSLWRHWDDPRKPCFSLAYCHLIIPRPADFHLESVELTRTISLGPAWGTFIVLCFIKYPIQPNDSKGYQIYTSVLGVLVMHTKICAEFRDMLPIPIMFCLLNTVVADVLVRKSKRPRQM